jgi:hypothetical protein
MAVRTIRPVAFADGLAYAEYEYDDVSGEIMTVRGVNDGPGDMTVSIRGSEDSGQQAKNVNYSYTFIAGSGLTEWDLTPGQRKKFTLVPDGGDPGRDDYYPTLAGLAVEAGYDG